MKKILVLSILVLCVLASVGCGAGNSSAGGGPTQTYELEGGTVTFTTPPSPWAESKGTETPAPTDGTMSDKPVTVGVSFHKPESKGFFAVGTMAQNADVEKDPKTGKEISRKLIELENDQDTLDVIAYWVIKRDGEILKKDYIPIAGTKAFWMEFELGKPEERMKGQQAHFTKDGTHWTLSMLMPSADYDSELKHFQAMISSFKLDSPSKPAVKSTP